LTHELEKLDKQQCHLLEGSEMEVHTKFRGVWLLGSKYK
jgi:hypothetical protein